MNTSLLLTASIVTMAALAHGQTTGVTEESGEALRPRVHYSPQRNWMNDPNGPVYFDGEYHLFYQYNPNAAVMGHISWGHAVSKDLLHWRELGVAIPEADGQMIFTGTVVVDENNTSGLCANGDPCMIAVYTAHSGDGSTQLETQDLAASQDHGRTWSKYTGNPVLNLHMANFRDPSVTWNEETKDWLMAVVLPDDHKVVFYTSSDLKHWTELSRFGPANGASGGQWECPSLLHVPSGDGQQGVWALKVGINPGALQGGSGEQFFLGSFDGKTFTQSGEPGSHGWTDYGKDSYCAVPFNHLPSGSRPTLIAWMDNWQYADKLPTSPWRGQMTLPRELTVVHDGDGFALVQRPLVSPLRNGGEKPVILRAKQGPNNTFRAHGPTEFALRFEPGQAQVFGVRLYSDTQHWTEVGFDKTRHSVYVDRTHSGQRIAAGFPIRTDAPLATSRPLDLHMVLDRMSLEVFAQGGTVAITNLIFPLQDTVLVRAFSIGNAAGMVANGHAWNLQSVHVQNDAQ